MLAATCALVAAAVAPRAALSQSTTAGQVSGVVTSGGVALPGAVVTLTDVGGGSEQDATTDGSGRFTFSFVAPGAYELRVEAVGYRPVVARTLTIGGGESRVLTLSLGAARPPVVRVDTISLAGATSSRVRPGGVQLGPLELRDLPHRFDDLGSTVRLSPSFDGSLGTLGLPGSETLVLLDGMPVYRAPHPSARAELLAAPLIPVQSLSGVTAFHNPPDIEWAGGAGGYVAAATRTTTGTGGFEADAAYAGDLTWQSGALDVSAPSLLSLQGGLRGTLASSPTSRLVLSADALRQQTPFAPRISETVAQELGGLDPDLLTSLRDPGVESYTRVSGLGRLDVQRSLDSRFFLRGVGSFARRDFDGAGPLALAGASAPAEESIDFSLLGGLLSRSSPRMALEVRAGVAGSFRTFDPAVADRPAGELVEAGARLGSAPAATGESSRTDFLLTPLLRFTPGSAAVKIGVPVRLSLHSMTHSRAAEGDFAYSDAAALLAGQGYGLRSAPVETSFATRELGVFAQYEAPLSPGVRFTLGARYDYETLADTIGLAGEWLATSGLDNTEAPTSFHQLGLRGVLVWDAVANGATRLFAVGSVQEGDVDPRALHQLLAAPGEATTARGTGSDLAWPAGTLTATDLPTITLFGPDARAPRTVTMSGGIAQRLADGVTGHVRGARRRTDFLMRRRNLNLPVVPQALDPDGRMIFGSLAQDGALVTATADDARRFAAFGDVWALDPDGWSEHQAVGAGLEVAAAAVDLYASYTYSETTDNWVGARSGLVDAELDPGLPEEASPDGPWAGGTSDFDVPHRLAAGVTVRLGAAAVSAAYSLESGLPFTPRYRYGVDANGDGSLRNDVAFVPGDAQLAVVLDAWPCLEPQAGSWARRNSCRGPARHALDARVRVDLGRVAGARATLVVDGLNLIEGDDGVRDEALLLVDPAGTIMTSPDGETVTLPVSVNPDFGTVLYPTSRGRMLRIGVRIGR